YAELFGGQIVFQSTFGEMPPEEGMPPLPKEARQRIMHANLQVKGQSIMASDALPAMSGFDPEVCGGGYRKPQGLYVSIAVDTAAEGQRVFEGLAKGGQVTMPFEKTFWSEGFGMVTDRFNIPWMVNVASESQAH